MTESLSFNVWTEPWITVERLDGVIETLGIAQTLLQAHALRAIYDPSPLVIVGAHRLLTAVLQAIYAPKRASDLKRLWDRRDLGFESDMITTFEARYRHRFDIFSPDLPFMQSADLPMKPDKSSKTVGYLADEIPAGTAVTHFRHGRDEDKAFCPVCAAKGLVCIPAFASSGGAGIKPSINGVPPIYVLPTGTSLYEALIQSLLLPAFQPAVAADEGRDTPVWLRNPVIVRGAELTEVGYLHSLTFSARRVRLQPQRQPSSCTRCGCQTDIVVRSIVYEMGECRPKDAPFWQDPFAAYREQEDKQPIPVRPTEGKALWREFNSLFLKGDASIGKKKIRLLRPRILDQLDSAPWAELITDAPMFRCIGMRTDMKAKIFDWLDASFSVPVALMVDQSGGVLVGKAIECAESAASTIFSQFKTEFNASSKNGERFDALRRRMRESYWASLALPFRDFILGSGDTVARDDQTRGWVETVHAHALRAFKEAARQVGDDAVSLRQRVVADQHCARELGKLRTRYAPAVSTPAPSESPTPSPKPTGTTTRKKKV